jgi:hypothetical protein
MTIRPLTGSLCRSIAFLLTGVQIPHREAAKQLLLRPSHNQLPRRRPHRRNRQFWLWVRTLG